MGRKTKQNKRLKKRRTQKKSIGGQLLGDGAFGKVYGNPRLLCDGETLDTENIHNEASKIFEYQESATEEFDVLNRLKEKMTEHEIDELKKYCLLPSKICDVDYESTKQFPYNSRAWRKDKNGGYGENPVIFNSEIGLPFYSDEYQKMVIYEKGGNPLNLVFESIDNKEKFLDCLNKLVYVGKGIQILQAHGFIHGDIKDKNCIEKDGKFMIIDMADVRRIDTTTNSKEMPYAFGYFTWPSISCYTYFFDDNVPKINDINMTNATLLKLYKNQQKYNETMYTKFVKKYLFDPFNIDMNNGFEQKEIEYAMDLSELLMKQKTFDISSLPFGSENLQDFVSYLAGNYSLGQNSTLFLKNMNNIFSRNNFGTIAELKLDLFKRIDIYSFGILILECIGKFIKNIHYQTVIDEMTRKKIMTLYDLVITCCYQGEHVADINDIMKRYIEIVGYSEPAIQELPKESSKKYTKKTVPVVKSSSYYTRSKHFLRSLLHR